MKLLQKVKKIENKTTKRKLHGDEAAQTAKLRSLKTLWFDDGSYQILITFFLELKV